MNFLFPAGGRRVETVEIFRRSLPRDRMLIADVDATAPALYAGHKAFLVPKFSDPKCLPRLLTLCRREKVTAIVPLIDPEIEFYARHAAELEAAGVRVLLSSPDASRIGRSKWETYEFFRSVGVPVAPMALLPRDVDFFPAIAKPAAGSAGQGVVLLRDRAQLRKHPELARGHVFQPKLSGDEITVDVIGDGTGAVLASCQRKRLKTRAGEAERAVTMFDRAVDTHIRRISAELKPYGAINIQLFKNGASLRFQEMNLRLGGGWPLAYHAGIDIPRLLRGVLDGGSPSSAPKSKPGIYMLRFDKAYYPTRKDMAHG